MPFRLYFLSRDSTLFMPDAAEDYAQRLPTTEKEQKLDVFCAAELRLLRLQ